MSQTAMDCTTQPSLNLCDFLVKFSALFILQIWRSTVNLSLQVRIYTRGPREAVCCLSVHCCKTEASQEFLQKFYMAVEADYEEVIPMSCFS